MYRGLWAYRKVGKKPVCGAKIFTAYRHAERGGGENLRPFRIAKVLRECVLSRYLPRLRQRRQCRTAEA